MSFVAGPWKVLATSVAAAAGLMAVGLAAVPVLVPHPQPPVEAVNVVAPSSEPSLSTTAPSGWVSAGEQYRAAQAQQALTATDAKLVSGAGTGEIEWVTAGGHLSRGVVLRAVKAPRGPRDEDRQGGVGRSERAKPHGTASSQPSQTSKRSSSDTSSASGGSTGTKSAPAAQAAAQVPRVSVRLAQANIYYDLPPAKWLADYERVRALHPDFITLNEAAYRTDAELAVDGYAIKRGYDNSSTRETPVLWRTDRWTEVASGTSTLTNRKVKWGVRAVNWVTLKHLTTGKVVSVISAHPAPTVPATQGLLTEFMTGLTALVNELDASGPVFVGGDLNVHYESGPYPTDALASAGLSATYDTLGRPDGGTGDHRGGIIDYLLYQPSKGVKATEQGKVEQNSDHDTMWGDFTLPR